MHHRLVAREQVRRMIRGRGSGVDSAEGSRRTDGVTAFIFRNAFRNRRCSVEDALKGARGRKSRKGQG